MKKSRFTEEQIIGILREREAGSSLIERIDVHPGAERGRCEVIIVGALAQILAFTQQQTTAVPGGDDGTFLMVAGARNRLNNLLFDSPLLTQ